MPKPPAAFSPLMMTQSSFQSAISLGSRSSTIARPLRPTMSPTNRRRTGSRPAIDHLALGEHEVEPRVMRQRRNFCRFLQRKGEADRRDRLAGAQGVKRAVVVTGAVADPVAAPVERRQRHDQQVGIELGRVGLGLAYAPLAAVKLLAERKGAEAQGLAALDNRWQRQSRAGGGEPAQQRHRVYFAADGRE